MPSNVELDSRVKGIEGRIQGLDDQLKADLASSISNLEVQVKANLQKEMLKTTTITQTNLLNQLVKSYDKNIKIVGMTYNAKDSKSFNKKAYETWSVKVIKGAFVDTKVLKEEEVFVKTDGVLSLIRGIISNIHPLSPRNNAAIVVAFNEASFSNQIKEMIRQNRGLSLGSICIHTHLPPIIESLHNAALKARSELLERARRVNVPRKIHCNLSLYPPWVHLVEVRDGGVKEAICFVVEDGRLADPANSMAILALRNAKFVPYKILSQGDKQGIPKNVLVNPPPKVADPHPNNVEMANSST